jgi:Tol biopolymer transport system component
MFGSNTNLWQIGIDPKSYRSVTEPTRLTWGTSTEWQPTVALQQGNRLRMVFASLEENSDIWGVPASPHRDSAGGQPRRLTEEASREDHPSISPDGRTLAFVSNRTGSDQVWLKNLDTGEQTLLTTSPTEKYGPVFSRDGAYLTYATSSNWAIHRLRLSDGADDLVCGSCGWATSWTSGNEGVLYNDVPGRISLLDLASRRSTLLVAKENFRFNAELSPDGRWILLRNPHPTYVAPYRGPSRIEERDWIAVCEGGFGRSWRPDGNAIYFISRRDGFPCLWLQPLDPLSKRPSGAPVAVYHAHNAQYSLGTWLSVRAGMVVFTQSEHTGSLWMAEWK